MTAQTSERADSIELDYKGHSMRALQLRDGVPWFALPDLCDALGYHQEAMGAVERSDFPEFAKMVVDEAPDPEIPGEPEKVTILSPTGVWYWTHYTDPWRGQDLAAWAKREAKRLCPDPAPGDPAVFLTLLPGCELPPYPTRYSGRKREWIDLRECDAYLFRGAGRYAPRRERLSAVAS